MTLRKKPHLLGLMVRLPLPAMPQRPHEPGRTI
ncbi:rCG47428 [Rattus norvegicus]|uniref:RCG47428 n=1 Tax=Rattus norvegicus TaxID=10116 RepID=A6HYS2_RAT|nr:rCG47428 [Rattus norvegicus]